ncbi:MAG: ABC transporter permease [Pirellulaceae bacterium]|nr:ABC transporter permease [Pirellulaceae bacterium]
MRPYLAVILDSFHAALSSRVLWIAFIAIWILLGALAPVGYREDYTTEFRRWDFDNGTQLKAMLAQGLADPAQENTALGRIAKAMPGDLQRQLQRVAQGDEVRIRTSVLADGLNEAIDNEQWYDAATWQSTARLRELRELDEVPDDDLSDVLRRRRARLRIEAALPGVFEARASRSILLTYAGFDFPAHLPFGKSQFEMVVNQFVLPVLMNWLLGFVLIFLGILVTASIVPDMLQPGSLHLLLSKPVSRSMLLISKFVGGCAFVFLCVCQLVGGLWLIAGLRLDIWNPRLLWCIPVAVFLFSVFYSVSFLAGLRWRTPILAIGITCMFGAFVLVIGAIGGYFDGFVTQPAAIRSIAVANEDVLATTRGGGIFRFDETSNQWQPLIEPDPRQADLVLPLVKLDDNHIATARIKGGRFNPYGSGSLDLLLLERSSAWEPEPGLRLPIATRRLFALADQSLIAMNTGGLAQTSFQRVYNSVASTEAGDNISDETSDESEDGSEQASNELGQATALGQADVKSGGWLTDLIRMRGGATSEFESILPPGVVIVQPARVVPSDDGSWMIVYSLGRMARLKRPDSGQGAWSLDANHELEGDAATATVVALSGSKLLIARRDESPMILDAATFELIGELELPRGASIFTAKGLGDGKRFVAVMSDGSCQIIHIDDGVARLDDSPGISEVESVAVDLATQTLAVAHHTDRVDLLDAETMTLRRQIRPTLEGWRFVDRYFITPLRTLTPQTGELGQTVSALVGGQSAIAIGQNGADDGEVLRLKMVRPILSCAGFIGFMLIVSCTYFSTRDF